jgi:hypothetical protein
VTQAQRRLALPRPHAVGAHEAVGDRRDLHRAQAELGVADVDAVLDDVAHLHGHALAGERDAQHGVRAGGHGADARVVAVARPVEAVAHHVQQLGVVGRRVAVAEDGAHLVAGEAQQGGGGLLGEAHVDARHLQLGREAADVGGGRLDLLAELGEGVLTQREGLAHGAARERDAHQLHGGVVHGPEGPAAQVGDGHVAALAVVAVGVEHAGRGVLEAQGIAEVGPALATGRGGQRAARPAWRRARG